MRAVRLLGVLLVPCAMTLTGCSAVMSAICSCEPESEDAALAGFVESPTDVSAAEQTAPMIVSATGYGARDTQIENQAQQMLMAMRASEVDAYRRLAERVHGMQISGGTKVVDFIADYDHLQAVVDSRLQRARVISQGFVEEGYYETTLSLSLDDAFFQNFSSPFRVQVVASPSETTHRRGGDEVKGKASALNTRSSTDVHYHTGGVRPRWGSHIK